MRTTFKTQIVITVLVTISVFTLRAQFSCATAVPIANGYTSGWITTSGTNGAQNWITSAVSCGAATASSFTDKDIYLYRYTTGSIAGESFYFTIEQDYVTDGPHSIGVWTACSSSTLSGCVTSAYIINQNIIGVCAQNLAANTVYYIGIGKQYWANSFLDFKVIDFEVESSLTAPNDECAGASNVNVFLPYNGSTRCNYTASSGSPSGCGTIENDAWMRFTAASTSVVIDYNVGNCSYDYGVQLAVFRGSCGSNTLIPGSCVNYASNNSSGTWSFSGLTVGATYYIRADGYAGDLCSYAFTPVSGILPVELIDFSATQISKYLTNIKWTTASEINNAYFEIEKSNDAIDFYSIGRIKSLGVSYKKTEYSMEDLTESNSNTSYYRLKQVDYDGKYQYSRIISVSKDADSKIEVFPNPSNTGTVELKGINFENTIGVAIYDVYGKEILFKNNQELISNHKIDLSEFGSGVYYVIVKQTHQTITKKIIIQSTNN